MEVQPPGFGFYPTEEELIAFYLRNRIHGRRLDAMNHIIPTASIYDTEPWCLPEISGELCRRDAEQWFFFVPRQGREARGGRPTRTTPSGYWKATGSPSYVYSSENKAIGLKKTMVFYRGKAPAGRKTEWKMNEYRALEQTDSGPPGEIPTLQANFALCRVYVTSGNLRAFNRRPTWLHVGDAPEKLPETTDSSLQQPLILDGEC